MQNADVTENDKEPTEVSDTDTDDDIKEPAEKSVYPDGCAATGASEAGAGIQADQVVLSKGNEAVCSDQVLAHQRPEVAKLEVKFGVQTQYSDHAYQYQAVKVNLDLDARKKKPPAHTIAAYRFAAEEEVTEDVRVNEKQARVVPTKNIDLCERVKEPPDIGGQDLVSEGWAEHEEDDPLVLRLKKPPDKLSVFCCKKLLCVGPVKMSLGCVAGAKLLC